LNKLPELVIPAQNWNSLKCIKDLADAIYFGVESYNMRAKAKNFDKKDLKQIVEFCHNQNPSMKAYLCTNILIYDSELKDLENLLSEGKEAKIDAIIAHDIAVIKLAKKIGMNFHISTQANVSNAETARFYEDLDAERIILARELSLNQIKAIKRELMKSKIECFVHGSMCSSISGRCYFSASICNSEEYSANRGNCVQPCRREWRVFDEQNNEFLYDGQMFLNAKDLCMIEHIPELIDAGIDAFKIEGRMKDPLYIKTVAECYHEALDCFFNNTYTQEKIEYWLEKLSKVHNRGFHTGFYFQRPTLEDIQLERRGNISPYKKTYVGKILSFDEKSMSANALIEKKECLLKVGDEIIISGENTYHIEKLRKLIMNGKKVLKIEKNIFEKTVKFNFPLSRQVKANDNIYLLFNKRL
jgi:putative protease